MAYKVDFDDLRAKVTITQVAAWLGITVKGNGASPRGPCPLCEAERDFTITPAKNLWGCWKCGKKGTIIDLVAHVRGIKLPEAAQLIQEQFLGTVNSTGRDRTVTVPRTDTEQLARIGERLDAEHPCVDALGISTEFATRYGIGYSATGSLKGTIGIPFRDENGELICFFGVTELAYVPKVAEPAPENVVPMKRPA